MNKQMLEDQDDMTVDILFQAKAGGTWRQFKFTDSSLDSLIDKFRAFAISLGYTEAEVAARVPYQDDGK